MIETLIVEDNQEESEIITRCLSGKIRADVTNAFGLAMEMLKANPGKYDIVLLDLNLFDTKKEETIERLPEMVEVAGCPIMVLTGQENLDDVLALRCRERGASSFWLKTYALTMGCGPLLYAMTNNYYTWRNLYKRKPHGIA